jgi:hypothetical protein
MTMVIETRVRRYPARLRVNRPGKREDRRDERKWGDDPGGVGLEVAKEIRVCAICASSLGT